MKCNEIIFEIVPFCCGDLDEQKEKEFKRHTTICKDCARYFFRIRKAVRYLHENVPQKQPIELSYDIQINRQG